MTACRDPNRLSGVKSTSDGNTYTYDANDNMFSGAGRTDTWTAYNRMDVVNATTGSAITSFDYTGIRVKKSPTAGTTCFPYTGYEVQGLTVTKYIKIGTEIIASKRDGVGKLFYHNDHLGGVNVIFAVMVQLDEYDPCERVSEKRKRISLTHAFCFSRLASGIRGLTPLKRFESCFQDLQESAGDFSNDLHNDFSLAAQPYLRAES
jgi:hypothetical protein